MSGLYTSLTMAARALSAQQLGLEVTGNNIANVNTAGYARRTIDFAAVRPESSLSAGNGVEVTGIRSIRDRLLERRVLEEVPSEGRAQMLAEILQVVEAGIGTTGNSIDGRLTEMFGSFSRLADAPTSAVARADVLNTAAELTQSFHEMAGRLADAQRQADTRVRTTVEEINALVDQISSLNHSMGASGPEGRLPLQDQMSSLLRSLNNLVNVDVVERSDGGVDITVGSGRALVIGDETYRLEAVSQPPIGWAAVQAGGMDITSELRGGRLVGAVEARDVNIPDYLTRLDTIAYELVNQVNTIHRAGFDQLGNTNQNFFTPLAAVAGAARLIEVDGAVEADSRLIAAAEVYEVGDNGVAKRLTNLRDALVLEGNSATLIDSWSHMAFRVGRDTRAAVDGLKAQSDIVEQIDALRDSVSGVSLDEEAVQMIKFQRAYEANARFFSTIDQTLSILFSIVWR
jgi:flagellar hook-associated protein 1 FlgK